MKDWKEQHLSEIEIFCDIYKCLYSLLMNTSIDVFSNSKAYDCKRLNSVYTK